MPTVWWWHPRGRHSRWRYVHCHWGWHAVVRRRQMCRCWHDRACGRYHLGTAAHLRIPLAVKETQKIKVISEWQENCICLPEALWNLWNYRPIPKQKLQVFLHTSRIESILHHTIGACNMNRRFYSDAILPLNMWHPLANHILISRRIGQSWAYFCALSLLSGIKIFLARATA